MLSTTNLLGSTKRPCHLPQVKFTLIPPLKNGGKGLWCVMGLPKGPKGRDKSTITWIIQEGSVKFPHSGTITNTIIKDKLDQQLLMIRKERRMVLAFANRLLETGWGPDHIDARRKGARCVRPRIGRLRRM